MFEIGCIYCIENKINGKKYVGQTKRDLNIRLSEHKSDSKKKRGKLYNAIRKYGIDNFRVKVLKTIDNTEDRLGAKLGEYEKYYIEKYNTIAEGYNVVRGGEFRMSEDYFYGEEKALKVIKILNDTDLSYKEIANIVGANKDFVMNISNGNTYTYLWDYLKDNKRRIDRLEKGVRKGYKRDEIYIGKILKLANTEEFTIKTIWIMCGTKDYDYSYVRAVCRTINAYNKKYIGEVDDVEIPKVDLNKLKLMIIGKKLKIKGMGEKRISELTYLSESLITSIKKTQWEGCVVDRYLGYHIKRIDKITPYLGIDIREEDFKKSDRELAHKLGIDCIVKSYNVELNQVKNNILGRKKVSNN